MMTNVWNLDLPATPMDMDDEIVDFGLCDMIRGEYLKKLHETLTQNLGALLQDCPVDQNIESYVNTCMAEMEKKAIRNCMVASLYREGMARMINDVKTSTNEGYMHSNLKEIIVNSSIELQSDDIPAEGKGTAEVYITSSHIQEQMMDIEVSGNDSSASIAEKNLGEFNVPHVIVTNENKILATHSTSDSYDANKIFKIAVEKYKRTGIRQRSVIPSACIDPTTMRTKIVNTVLANPVKSDHVAETYEFRRQLKELPEEIQVRVDEMLDRYFSDTTGTQLGFKLSEPEEQSISFKRIVRLVVAHMKPFYDASRITKTMFKALAELITKNFTFDVYDPSEETIARTVNAFFADNTAYICRYEDINSHFIVQ